MRLMVRVLLAIASVLGLYAASALQAVEPSTPAAKLARAQQAFLAYCGMCHGPRGAGDGEVAAALKRSSIIVPRLDDAARLAKIGREGVLRIVTEGGAHVGRSNVMPEWGGLVGAGLAGDLADYVMSLPGQGPASRRSRSSTICRRLPACPPRVARSTSTAAPPAMGPAARGTARAATCCGASMACRPATSRTPAS